jgi:hypothetical protein
VYWTSNLSVMKFHPWPLHHGNMIWIEWVEKKLQCGDVGGAELFNKLETEPQNNLYSIPVLRIRIRDPAPGAFLPPGSGSGSGVLLSRIPDPTYFCIKAINKIF